MKKHKAIPALIVVGLLSANCAKPWQAARTVVQATAEGVQAANLANVEAYEASSCAEEQNPDVLRECVRQLNVTTEALRGAREILLTGESIVDVWEDAQERPSEWSGWLVSAAQVVARLVSTLAEFGVPIPDELDSIADALDQYLEPLQEGEEE